MTFKTQKKILSLIMVFVSLCSMFALSGCGDNEPEYKQVQSVSYFYGDNEITVYSKIHFIYSTEDVSEEEYNNAENKGKYYDVGIIKLDKTVENQGAWSINDGAKPEELKSQIGKVYYDYKYPSFAEPSRYGYVKKTFTDLVISYLEIKIVDDNTFILRYYSSDVKEFIAKEITSNNFVVNYFID